jgi:raffinose/stachyose/melibiose transport system permease protein
VNGFNLRKQPGPNEPAAREVGLRPAPALVGTAGLARAGHRLLRVLIYIVLGAALFFTLVPMIWVVVASLRTSRDVSIAPLGLPNPIVWENYSYAWTQAHLDTYFRNSIVVTFWAVILVVTVCSLAGYAFARLRFLGKKVLFSIYLFGLMIPAEAMILPLFIRIRDLHLLNNLFAVVLTFSAAMVPFGCLLMRTFFADIPQEIQDAAAIDGADELQMFTHVLLPIASPGVVTLSILAFVWSWNDFLHPFLFLTRTEVRTLPVAMISFQKEFGEFQVAPMLAAAVVTILPLLVAYVLLQRRFMQGIAAGALKG